MHKITTDTRTSDDEFVDEDASQGIQGTDLNADWYNTVQRELCNAVTGSGQTLSASDDSQLLKALKSVKGLKVVNGGSGYLELNGWTGNTVFLCNAADVEVDGTLDTGSLIVCLPAWYAGAANSIKFTYNGAVLQIPKGQGFFGIALNDSESMQFNYRMFAAANNNGYLMSNGIVDTGLVTVSGSSDDITDAGFRTWMLYSNWSINQVKRVRAATCTGDSYTVKYFRDSEGTVGKLEFFAHGYREVMCIGSYKNADDNNTYAVLLPNGPAVLPTTTTSST